MQKLVNTGERKERKIKARLQSIIHRDGQFVYKVVKNILS